MPSSGGGLATSELRTDAVGGGPSPPRLTLVIATLAMGGAERVLSTLANYWAARGSEITLITLDGAENDFFPVHPQVRRVALELAGMSGSLWQASRSNLRRVAALRRAIRASRADAVIGFTDAVNILTLLATRRLAVPVIVAERVDPTQQPLSRVWERLRRLLYPRADAVVVQTEAIRRWAEHFVPAAAIHTIPNPVAPLRHASGAWGGAMVPDEDGCTVLGMGRLSAEKGFDLLLRAFACCRQSHPEWRLVILGEGTERSRLEALAAELGIAQAVRLPGRVPNPEAWLRRAELFVMSSHYEGFPNALLEAMACGTAAISTDCPSGPSQIVRSGIDGLLVPPGDVHALAAAMQRLMSDPEERRRLGSRAVEVRDRFALEAVMEQWERLVERVIAARRSG